MAPLKNRRFISSKEITKNMTLYTNEPFKSEVDNNSLEWVNNNNNKLTNNFNTQSLAFSDSKNPPAIPWF